MASHSPNASSFLVTWNTAVIPVAVSKCDAQAMLRRCAKSSQIRLSRVGRRKLLLRLRLLLPRSECSVGSIATSRACGNAVNAGEHTISKSSFFATCMACQPKLSSAPYFPMAAEESHDSQDDCRFGPHTIVVGTVYVRTFSQSRIARSR